MDPEADMGGVTGRLPAFMPSGFGVWNLIHIINVLMMHARKARNMLIKFIYCLKQIRIK